MEKLKRILVTLCFFLASTFVLQAASYCQDAAPVICDQRISLDLGGGLSKPIPYCRNYSLDAPNSSIERAVIVIHGVDRNAVDYYKLCINGCCHGERFERDNHYCTSVPASGRCDLNGQDVVFWANDGEGWSRGDHSCTGDGTCGGSGAGTISSFTVIDRILETLSDRVKFPNLTRIVITGHSAGGQFVNRFAGGSQAEGQLKRKHINVRYIVSNPSSYLYFSKERWDDKSDKRLFQYKVPDQAAVTGCPRL